MGDGYRPGADLQTKTFLPQITQRAQRKAVSFCRVGIAHHHGTSIGCILSGNARPTFFTNLLLFFSRSLRPSRQNAFPVVTTSAKA